MPLPSAAARCRCRVRTPMPLRGACGGWYWQAVVGRQSLLRGAQQARAARCRRRVRTPMPLRRACGGWYRQAVVGRQDHFRGIQVRLHCHFRGAQQARSAPRTNVRELFCGSKIMRNDSDEAERSERSPFGVVSAANGEELAGAARQVRGPPGPPANGSAWQVNGSSEASGEVRTRDWKAEMNLRAPRLTSDGIGPGKET